jgi:hypothetical protein
MDSTKVSEQSECVVRVERGGEGRERRTGHGGVDSRAQDQWEGGSSDSLTGCCRLCIIVSATWNSVIGKSIPDA